MMQIPVLAWVFQTIPESIALAALVMSLGTRDLPWKVILKIAIIYAITIYIVRLMPFTPGVHVIVLAAALGIISILCGGLEMRRGMVFSAIAVAILVLLEFAANYSIVTFGIFTIDEIRESIIPRIVGGYPHTIVLFILAIIVKVRRISLEFLFRPRIY